MQACWNNRQNSEHKIIGYLWSIIGQSLITYTLGLKLCVGEEGWPILVSSCIIIIVLTEYYYELLAELVLQFCMDIDQHRQVPGTQHRISKSGNFCAGRQTDRRNRLLYSLSMHDSDMGI